MSKVPPRDETVVFSCAGAKPGGCDATFTVVMKASDIVMEAQLPRGWSVEQDPVNRRATIWCPLCRPKAQA